MTTRKQREEAKRIHRNQLQRERRHRKAAEQKPRPHTHALMGLHPAQPEVPKATGPIFTATTKVGDDRSFVMEFPFGVHLEATIQMDGNITMALFDSFVEGASQGETVASEPCDVYNAVEAAHARSRANGATVLNRAGFAADNKAMKSGEAIR